MKGFLSFRRWLWRWRLAFVAWLPLCQVAHGADDLAKRIDDIRTQLSPKTDPDVAVALAKLFEAMPCDSRALSPSDKTRCQLFALETLFKKFLNSAGSDADKKKLQDEILKVFFDSDVLLETEIKQALAAVFAPPARIHIVAAYYGHLDDIAYALKNFRIVSSDDEYSSKRKAPSKLAGPRLFSELNAHSYISDRLCPATRALRALCQGQKSCGFDATTVLSGHALCGFEPAPYAESRMKGLVIRYRCNSDLNWRPEQDFYDGTENKIPDQSDQPPSERSNPLTGAPQWALLRAGEIAKIICTLPADPTAKVADQ